MTNSQSKQSKQSKQSEQSNPKMQIRFFTRDGELYLGIEDGECTMEDYSNSTWNDCVLEQMKLGTVKKDTFIKCCEAYAARINELKELAIPYGTTGMIIVREITRIATKHLEFVAAHTDMLSSQNKGKSGFKLVELTKK